MTMSAVLSPTDDYSDDRQVAQLRIPPHSIEAESSVLGGLLLDNGAWDRVGDLLTDDDFYRYEHKLVYGAIGALVNASKPADVITVFEHLQSQGKADEIGGLALSEFAGPVRAQRRQYPPLRRDRARTFDPAQAGQRQRRDRHQRLQSQGPAGGRHRRRGRAQDLQDRRAGLAHEAGFPGHGHAGRGPAGPRAGDGRQPERRDRCADRLLRPGPHDGGFPGRRPDRAGGASVHGQDGVCHQHRRTRGA